MVSLPSSVITACAAGRRMGDEARGPAADVRRAPARMEYGFRGEQYGDGRVLVNRILLQPPLTFRLAPFLR